MTMYLFMLAVFAGATYFFDKRLALIEGIVVLLLVFISIISARRKRKALAEYIQSVTYNVEAAKTDTLLNFPLPMAVYMLEDNRIVWANQVFFDISNQKNPYIDAKMTDLIPNFVGKFLMEGKTQYPELLEFNGRKYQIHGNIVRSNEKGKALDFMGITYWLDVTEYDAISQEYLKSRPIVAVVAWDNFDEMMKKASDRERTTMRSDLDEKISQWVQDLDGFHTRPERDRYILIFEERYLEKLVNEKFTILNAVQDIVCPYGIAATVSIGVGKGGSGFEENYSFANIALEMSLSRGGDQAVIKNRFNFEFFGGRGIEVETRTKVKSRVMANALFELIGDASKVYIMGHKFADYDSIGAAVGICCIARKRGKAAKIIFDKNSNASTKLIERLEQEHEYKHVFITPQQAILEMDLKSLLVIVDTNRPEQVEDESILMSANKIAVIDHHRRAATYIENAALTFLEPYASSVCELMAELLQELVSQSDILRVEAEAMLAGIVMDTKNFTLRTGERTFDAAAYLRRHGADTVEVKRLLQNDFDHTVARYKILQSAKIYRSEIAIAAPDSPQDRIVAAQAADELLNISGITASIVIYPTEKGDVTISARSIGEINVQVLLESLGGGGNKSAAGAQIANIGIRDAINGIFKAIDDYYDN
ncbi:DHH family phosphoesterase [Clostridiaceae bacterium OttesenSCG-928-D20]|nr:DHH family phosphoesterase [Clostridiaceae bacterium OttesenSCG-928-D20]